MTPSRCGEQELSTVLEPLDWTQWGSVCSGLALREESVSRDRDTLLARVEPRWVSAGLCVGVCGVVVETPALQDLTFSLEDRNEQKFDTKDILATGTARQELRGTGKTARLLRALGRI